MTSVQEASVVADKLSELLDSTLREAQAAGQRAAHRREDKESGSGEDSRDGDGVEGGAAEAGPRRKGMGKGQLEQRQRVRHRFSLEQLSSLHGELLAAQAGGYLARVDYERLTALMLALHAAAGAGRNKLLAEDLEAKSPAVARVWCALEAVLCQLVVLAAPGLPAALYREEVLERAVELVKYHMQFNALAVADVRFRRMYRRDEADADAEEATGKGAKTPRGRKGLAACGQLPRWCGRVAGQVEQALALLAEVLGRVRVGAEELIPLVRMALQALTVEALPGLQSRAMGIVVSVFRHYPQHRNTVLNEFVYGVLSYLQPGKHVARQYPIHSTSPPARIQAASALLLQLVQAAAELPPLDAGRAGVLAAGNPPVAAADYFWKEVFKRLPSARATKADTSLDLRAWLEASVDDLLAALPLPEWPAAAVLLRRLILLLAGPEGLRAGEPAVRLAAMDVTGQLARALCGLVREAEAEGAAREVAALVEAARASAGSGEAARPEPAEVAQQLLLEHLHAEAEAGPAGGGAAPAVAASARQLLAVGMLAARFKAAKQVDQVDERQAAEAILLYRQIYERQRSCLGASPSGLPEVPRPAAVLLCRWLVADSVLGRSRATLLRWLAAAGGGSGRGPAEGGGAVLRAKAMRLLGGAIEADVGVLRMADVAEGIKGALGDESVLVREAAVDLVGKHISRSSDLAAQYYDILVRASEDAGLTVRKRAIRLLWACCVRCPDFVHRADALLRIVARATDPEDTMRALVTKMCAEIFFMPKLDMLEGTEDDPAGGPAPGPGPAGPVPRRPEQRAAQLGEVVGALYARLGPGVHLPLGPGAPIVATLRAVLGEEGKPEAAAVRCGAAEVAEALLGRALELFARGGPGLEPDTPGSPGPGEELLGCLVTLHALGVAEPRLLHSATDPQRLVRSLAPYIKDLPPAATDAASKRKAEALLAVLALLAGAIGGGPQAQPAGAGGGPGPCSPSAPGPGLRHLDERLGRELAEDLQLLILRVPHVPAVGVSVACLCALARLRPEHAAAVRKQAALYHNQLEGDLLRRGGAAAANPERRRFYPRFLSTLGLLCRHGADMLDEGGQDSKHPSCAAVLQLLLRFFDLQPPDTRLQEQVLQALGSLLLSRPGLAVSEPGVRPLLERCLAPAAAGPLKARCLACLAELLRLEEEALLARQAAAQREDAAAGAGQASTAPAAEGRALARRNGEGDAGSVCSGLVQMLWERILPLARDTTLGAAPPAAAGGLTPPPTPLAGAANHGAAVRRRCLELLDACLRGGVVVPWACLPQLLALATDPEPDTAARARACLGAALAGGPGGGSAYAAGQVPAGLSEAYALHARLAEAEGRRVDMDKCAPLLEGVAAVWSGVFQPDRALRGRFLQALLRPLDEGCCAAGGAAARSDPRFLSFLACAAAELPYRHMDELLGLLARLHDITQRRAQEVLGWAQGLRRQGQEAGAQQQQPAAGAAEGQEQAQPAAPSPLPGGGGRPPCPPPSAVARACHALSLVLLLKQYLCLAYGVAPDRVTRYDPLGPARKAAEKEPAAHGGRLRFNAAMLRADVAEALGAGQGAGAYGAAPSSLSPESLRAGVAEVYRVLKGLLRQDAEAFRHAPREGEEEHSVARPAAAAAGGDGEDGGEGAPLNLNLAEVMAAPGAGPEQAARPLRGRGSRGARGGRGARGAREAAAPPAGRGTGRGDRGRGRGRGRGRKRQAADSEEEEQEEEGDSGEEEEEHPRLRGTKRRG